MAHLDRPGQPAPALDLDPDRGGRARHDRDRHRIPHAVRPRVRHCAADDARRAQAARDAYPPRRNNGGVPLLLPRAHQFPVYPVDPDRSGDVRCAGGDHRRPGLVQRAAPQAGGRPAHGGPPPHPCDTDRHRAVRPLPARAGPALGHAAGCVLRHHRPVRHDGAGQPVATVDLGRDSLPRPLQWADPRPPPALLARPRAMGLRRPHLALRSTAAARHRRPGRGGSEVRVPGRHRTAQPQLALRAGDRSLAAAERLDLQ